jgi:hypothetical protein
MKVGEESARQRGRQNGRRCKLEGKSGPSVVQEEADAYSALTDLALRIQMFESNKAPVETNNEHLLSPLQIRQIIQLLEEGGE